MYIITRSPFVTLCAVSAPANTIAALSVLEVDSKYAALVSQLLGNVFIAENEQALQAEFDGVLLEKTGKYVKGKYTLTGGSVGIFEGKKIGRAKNLEKFIIPGLDFTYLRFSTP